MPSNYSLFGQKVKDTYPRLLQITEDNSVLDGSGNTRALSVQGNFSASTIYSGNTPLGQIIQSFISPDQNDITRVQPGTNISTGGTANFPIISIVDSPSFNNITVSGTGFYNEFSGTSISGGTYFSGETPLSQIIQSFIQAPDGSGFSGWTASTGTHSIKAVNSSVNLASGAYSFVVGKSNSATTIYSSVLGGKGNLATGLGSFIVGGTGNTVTGPISSILGGKQNSITSAFGATIAGGLSNLISINGSYANIAGGQLNICRGGSSTVGGGQNNTAYAAKSTVSGGHGNLALVNYSSIGGGLGNKAYGLYSHVGGGTYNKASGKNSIVAGGRSNSATSIYSSVVGGKTNLASGYASFVGGGTGNTASGIYSSVVGGKSNTASAIQSSIINGSGNTLISGAINSVILGQSDFTGGESDTIYFKYATGNSISASTYYSGSTELGVVIQKFTTGGTYTPNITEISNLSSSTIYQCQYISCGGVCTVSGKLNTTPQVIATNSMLGISLPIISDLQAEENCSGTACAPDVSQVAAIIGDSTNNIAKLKFISAYLTSQDVFFNFTYKII